MGYSSINDIGRLNDFWMYSDIYYCFDIKNNDSSVCSNHGSCIDIDMCICDNEFVGLYCNEKSRYWTWISGSDIPNENSKFDLLPFSVSSDYDKYHPGSRMNYASWLSKFGEHIYIFGGYNYNLITSEDLYFQDLWIFDVLNRSWCWMSKTKSSIINKKSNYGLGNIASETNIPSSRNLAYSWIDDNDDLWLFGGSGLDDLSDFPQKLRDLW